MTCIFFSYSGALTRGNCSFTFESSYDSQSFFHAQEVLRQVNVLSRSGALLTGTRSFTSEKSEVIILLHSGALTIGKIVLLHS
jgi:hypothetical protein